LLALLLGLLAACGAGGAAPAESAAASANKTTSDTLRICCSLIKGAIIRPFFLTQRRKDAKIYKNVFDAGTSKTFLH